MLFFQIHSDLLQFLLKYRNASAYFIMFLLYITAHQRLDTHCRSSELVQPKLKEEIVAASGWSSLLCGWWMPSMGLTNDCCFSVIFRWHLSGTPPSSVALMSLLCASILLLPFFVVVTFGLRHFSFTLSMFGCFLFMMGHLLFIFFLGQVWKWTSSPTQNVPEMYLILRWRCVFALVIILFAFSNRGDKRNSWETDGFLTEKKHHIFPPLVFAVQCTMLTSKIVEDFA